MTSSQSAMYTSLSGSNPYPQLVSCTFGSRDTSVFQYVNVMLDGDDVVSMNHLIYFPQDVPLLGETT